MSIFENLVGYWPLEKEIPGRDLFDPGAGGFETDIGAWTGGGGNGVEVSTDIAHGGSQSLKITFVDTTNGPYLFFRNTYDLFTDLIIGKKYRGIFWTAVNGGSSVTWQKNDGTGWTNIQAITSTSLVKIEFDFIATSTTGCGLRPNGLGAGEILYLDDISIQELYTPNLVGTEHGTVNGATRLALGKGYSFTTDDFIDLGNPVSLQITGGLTILALIKTGTKGKRIVSKATGGDLSYFLRLDTTTGKPSFGIYKSNTVNYHIADNTDCSDSQEHWVAGVHDGTDLRVYVDGIAEGKNSNGTGGTIDNDVENVFIGAQAIGVEHWEGDIRKVYIYNRALTQREIHQIFDGKLRERYYEEIYKDITQSQARAIAQGH